ncbi:Ig-like domain-containing protein [Piscinibacter sp. XHJ-5]|uniref:Ig-like domain-containing protein n=1 Tax=Piscinibacter sp. XHJ-5 TaxID=3037797 RepID=UPI0024534DD0|nr:Ig-like domain-containing protein [Piscinibacter sp. XHJ-5]
MKSMNWCGALAVCLAVAACGGGGGDSGTDPFGTGAGTGTGGTGTGGTGTDTGTDTGTPSTPTTPGGGISNVSTGVPNQRFMSMSVEKWALNWGMDGDTTKVTIRVADSAGNPVPEGTRVQFSTSGGQIVTSCALSGVAEGTATISACSVDFATQDFRPLSGRVSILAWLEGEEAYKDLNGNGAYDVGEPFADAGRLFRDDNGDKTFTDQVDELNVGATLASTPGIGSSACVVDPAVPVNDAPLSVPATCDGAWGRTFVRAAAYLPVSDPRYLNASVLGDTVRVWTKFGTDEVAAPSGTTLTVKTFPTGCTVSISPSSVPNAAVDPTLHTISSTGATCTGGSVGIEVKFNEFSKLLTATLP